MRYIPLGVAGRPFGIRGEIRLKPYNPRTTWFEKAPGVWLRTDKDSEPVFFPLRRARRHKEFILLDLEGVDDRDRAEELRAMEAVAPEDELEQLEEGEYYWHQLVGLEVETIEGEKLGRVIRMEQTAPELGGNDLFVVRTEEGELVIPATKEAVAEVDLSKSKMVVNPVMGTAE